MGDGPATKNRILEVAFRLFHEQGYHATSISTILREADVNSGSLYHYFPSKEALLVGVLDWAIGACHPLVMAPVEKVIDEPIERVFALLRQYRDGMEMFHCRMGCPIGNLALEVADDSPDARKLIDANFVNWKRHVRRWLDDERSPIPPHVDRDQLATLILTIMEGGIMQSRAAGNLKPFDDSIAQLRAYFDLLLGATQPQGDRP